MPLPLVHPLQTVMLSWNLLHGGVLFLEYSYTVSHPRVREKKRKKKSRAHVYFRDVTGTEGRHDQIDFG